MIDQELRAELLRLVQALGNAGFAPTLIGGLAVYFQRPSESSELAIDASSLAAVARPTKDIDFAVSFARDFDARAARTLEPLGYQRDATNRWRFTSSERAVDLVPCVTEWTTETTFEIDDHQLARPLDRQRISHIEISEEARIAVADPAMLIVQKSVAWVDRRKGSDLSDIATLSITDRVAGNRLAAHLDALLTGLPATFSNDVLRVAARFRTIDSRGPIAFMEMIEGAYRARSAHLSEDEEELIRRIARDAVYPTLARRPK